MTVLCVYSASCCKSLSEPRGSAFQHDSHSSQSFCGLGWERRVFEIPLAVISQGHAQMHTETVARQNRCVLLVAHLLLL